MRNEKEIQEKIGQTLFSCGVDEVGAGVLAGDLVVAAVILNPEKPIAGLGDSKKLSEKRREELYPEIMEKALDCCIIHINPQEVDRINILQARLLGFKRAILGLRKVEYAVIDGDRLPEGLSMEADYVIKGDSKIACISAASIVAKVTRDRQITKQGLAYPGYGFEQHKGYGTAQHLAALKKLGPCAIHRMSYKPVQDSIANRQNP